MGVAGLKTHWVGGEGGADDKGAFVGKTFPGQLGNFCRPRYRRILWIRWGGTGGQGNN